MPRKRRSTERGRSAEERAESAAPSDSHRQPSRPARLEPAPCLPAPVGDTYTSRAPARPGFRRLITGARGDVGGPRYFRAMTRRPRLATRPAPAFRASDGAPWPSDDELDLDAEWAALRESADIEWWADDEVPAGGGGLSDGPGSEAVADLDARLGHLELVVAERHRATAEEYRLIAAILADAAADPTPWVGPDPTLDGAWRDRRGRTAAAVRRDRLDMAQRAAVAEIALRLHLSEQTVRARATDTCRNPEGAMPPAVAGVR